MTALENATTTQTKSQRASANVIIGSLLGSTIEYYEFSIFVAAASLVFRKEFFPQSDPQSAVLLAFGTSAAAYAARPIGAILFGHLGDRIGRKPTMLATFIVMGVATCLMGLLPTHDSIGRASAVLLVILRIVQGLANGGEFGGAALMATESAPRGREGFYASSALTGLALGNLLGTGVFSLVTLLPQESFLSWGWRLPFIASIFLVIPGILVRRRLHETPAFETRVKTARDAAPLVTLLRSQPRRLALITGARMGETILFNVVTLFALDYATRVVGLQPSIYLLGLTIGSFLALGVTPTFGALSDRIGRKPVALIGGVVTATLGLVFLPVIQSGNALAIPIIVAAMMGIAASINNSTPGVWFPELFDPSYRYTAISVGYQFGAIAGGVTPILASLLVSAVGPVSVTVLLVSAGLLILTCASLLPESNRKRLS
jgi:MHS family shikimate/dehydroshikimate transporter-like MFS transporter